MSIFKNYNHSALYNIGHRYLDSIPGYYACWICIGLITEFMFLKSALPTLLLPFLNGPYPASFLLHNQQWPMTWFEPRTSHIGSDWIQLTRANLTKHRCHTLLLSKEPLKLLIICIENWLMTEFTFHDSASPTLLQKLCFPCVLESKLARTNITKHRQRDFFKCW